MSDKKKADLAVQAKYQGAAVRTSRALPPGDGVDILQFQIRYLPGGRQTFVELVKLAAENGDLAAEMWWKVYADLPKTHQKLCNLWDVCRAAGVKLSTLMAGVVGHAIESGEDQAKLIAAVLHPQAVAQAGKSALRISGPHADIALKDRENLLQAKGFLPVPRGQVTQVNVSANAQAAASALEPSVPKFADDLEALPEASRGFLPAPTGPTKVIDVAAVPERVER